MKKNKHVIWLFIFTSVLALGASVLGITNPSIYQEVVDAKTITQFLLIGSLAQDIITIPVSIITILLSLYYLYRPTLKCFIVLLGLIGYLFYGYGLYAIQGQYTSLYLLYLVIFSSSIYSLIFGFLSFTKNKLTLQLPNGIRLAILVFLSVILVMLIPIWLIRMAPNIATRVPQDVYGVFVFDLGIVFPAFAITIVQLVQKKTFGYVLAGVCLLKTVSICLSVAFGEFFLSTFEGFKGDPGMIIIFSGLTFFSACLSALYLVKLKEEK